MTRSQQYIIFSLGHKGFRSPYPPSHTHGPLSTGSNRFLGLPAAITTATTTTRTTTAT